MAESRAEKAVRRSLEGPQHASGAGFVATQHPLPDAIDAAAYLAAQKAVRRRNRGLRVQAIDPGGPVGPHPGYPVNGPIGPR